jgi:hypothetical protein
MRALNDFDVARGASIGPLPSIAKPQIFGIVIS